MLGRRRPTHTWLSWGFGNGLRWSAEGLDSWVRGDPDWPWVMAVGAQTPGGLLMRWDRHMQRKTTPKLLLEMIRQELIFYYYTLKLLIPVNKCWCWVILSACFLSLCRELYIWRGLLSVWLPAGSLWWFWLDTRQHTGSAIRLIRLATRWDFLSSVFVIYFHCPCTRAVPMCSFICHSNTWQKEILHFVFHYIHLAAILNGIF